MAALREKISLPIIDRKSMTVSLLKQELRKLKARTTGKKADLIERLDAYNRNFNFVEHELPPGPDPIDIPNWPESGFKQLTPESRALFSNINSGVIDGYFRYRMATDNAENKDIKALEKGKLLLDSHNIDACSLFVKTNDIYLIGIVKAAMKKRVSYNFKLRLQNDGEVLNSHCECPAGKGPHGTCKHIACALLMIAKLNETGEVLVNKSCTENQQSFHKPRSAHHGSPIKAQHLNVKNAKRTISLEDPRPSKYRKCEGYQDHVRSLILNYCSIHSRDITFRFLYEKADIQTAVIDHDYLQLPFTEYWIDTNIKVTESEADIIQKQTQNQRTCSKWFRERHYRLTASRFGDICKITNRRNKEKLCKSLLSSYNFKSKSIMHGRSFETVAIEKFQSQFQLKVEKAGFFVSVDFPFIGASPDGLINNDSIVEVKCPYTGRNEIIKPGTNFKFLQYDKDGKICLKPACNYFYQIQGQLFVTKRKYCYFIVYTFADLFVQKIEIDSEFCMSSLFPKLHLFWHKYMRPYIAENL